MDEFMVVCFQMLSYLCSALEKTAQLSKSVSLSHYCTLHTHQGV